MGSTLFSLLTPHFLHHFFLNPAIKISQNPQFSSSNFCRSSSSKRNWGSTRRFNFQDQFGRRQKRRNWWSDDDDDDDDDDEFEDDEDLDFGFWNESSSTVNWVFKHKSITAIRVLSFIVFGFITSVLWIQTFKLLLHGSQPRITWGWLLDGSWHWIFRAFGWMIPAIMISTLLGTESNSLVMAVVLPLGQTALSLVLDKLWGDPDSTPNFGPGPKPRSKSNSRRRSRPEWNPYVRPTSRSRGSRESRRSANSSYQAWGAAYNSSSYRGGQKGSKYGGWDELDQQAASGVNYAEEQRQKVEDSQTGYVNSGKLSQRRSRDKPLFIRLLIAMFPFVGSWTRFLF